MNNSADHPEPPDETGHEPEPAHTAADASASDPSPQQLRRWRKYLADEIAEGQLYNDLAARKRGDQRDILLGLAQAEKRHEDHWRELLGEHANQPPRPSARRMLLRVMARLFGSVFILALAQRAESDSPYAADSDATASMAADEAVHEEVIRGLARRSREKLAGGFRAAVFGANDGLVSNLALIMGMGGTGVGASVVLASGIAGLLAGALSMAAGEFISVRSQSELLASTRPTHITLKAAPDLDLDENELVLVYRARGMSQEDAEHRAMERMGVLSCDCDPSFSIPPGETEAPADDATGSAWTAAASSFFLFGIGAFVPLIPFLFGATGTLALVLSCVLVGLALLCTGGVVGLLSGASPLTRALRQLAIGLGAAGVTFILGNAFGVVLD